MFKRLMRLVLALWNRKIPLEKVLSADIRGHEVDLVDTPDARRFVDAKRKPAEPSIPKLPTAQAASKPQQKSRHHRPMRAQGIYKSRQGRRRREP